MPQALLQDYQKLLSSAPARRLNPSKVAQSRFLNNRLVEVVAFMENIAVKDSIEKASWVSRFRCFGLLGCRDSTVHAPVVDTCIHGRSARTVHARTSVTAAELAVSGCCSCPRAGVFLPAAAVDPALHSRARGGAQAAAAAV